MYHSTLGLKVIEKNFLLVSVAHTEHSPPRDAEPRGEVTGMVPPVPVGDRYEHWWQVVPPVPVGYRYEPEHSPPRDAPPVPGAPSTLHQ